MEHAGHNVYTMTSKMIAVTDFCFELFNFVIVLLFAYRCCLSINSLEDYRFRFLSIVIAEEYF